MSAATFKFKVLPKRMAKKSEAASYCGLSEKRFAAEFPFNRHSPSLETRGGWEYDVTDFFHFGSEVRYDTQEHAVAVIPQIWFTLPHKVTLKAGYSYDFGAMHERFLRTAFVIEF